MRNLAYQFKIMCDHNKDGSHSTQASRRRLLSMIAKHIELLGIATSISEVSNRNMSRR